MKLYPLFFSFSLLLPITNSHADAFEDIFKVKVGIQSCTCGATENAVLPITLDTSTRKMISVSALVKELQKKLPRTVTPKQAKLRTNIARFKKMLRDCSMPCKQTGTELGLPKKNPGTPQSPETPSRDATPTPTSGRERAPTPTAIPESTSTPGTKPTYTPTPKPTNTPTATPTPSDGGCFTANGDTQCFGIPNNLTGNVTSGSKVWTAFSCSGCHSEASKRGSTYGRVQAAFSNSSMAALPKPSQQEIAHITAYLNRYNR